MPAWMIDTFGSAKLNQIFWTLTLVPLPLWVAMILLPKNSRVLAAAHPCVFPVILALGQIYLYWQLWQSGAPIPDGFAMKDLRDHIAHPYVFLGLWAQLQALHLFVGVWLYREAARLSLCASFELILCWFVGVLALPPFLLHRFIRRGAK